MSTTLEKVMTASLMRTNHQWYLPLRPQIQVTHVRNALKNQPRARPRTKKLRQFIPPGTVCQMIMNAIEAEVKTGAMDRTRSQNGPRSCQPPKNDRFFSGRYVYMA